MTDHNHPDPPEWIKQPEAEHQSTPTKFTIPLVAFLMIISSLTSALIAGSMVGSRWEKISFSILDTLSDSLAINAGLSSENSRLNGELKAEMVDHRLTINAEISALTQADTYRLQLETANEEVERLDNMLSIALAGEQSLQAKYDALRAQYDALATNKLEQDRKMTEKTLVANDHLVKVGRRLNMLGMVNELNVMASEGQYVDQDIKGACAYAASGSLLVTLFLNGDQPYFQNIASASAHLAQRHGLPELGEITFPSLLRPRVTVPVPQEILEQFPD